MTQAGNPEKVFVEITGNRTRSVFERYNIFNDNDLKIAARNQEEYFKAQMGTTSGTFPKKVEDISHT